MPVLYKGKRFNLFTLHNTQKISGTDIQCPCRGVLSFLLSVKNVDGDLGSGVRLAPEHQGALVLYRRGVLDDGAASPVPPSCRMALSTR